MNLKKDYKNKRVLVDIDGVICEYDFPKIVKHFFGVDLSKYMLYAYNLADVLGVAPLAINTMFKEQVWGKPSFVPNAIKTLRQIGSFYRIIIFSNRMKYMGKEGLMDWLIDWGIPFDVIGDGIGEFDFHIDDSPAKLMTSNSKVKLLFDQPWNKGCLNITNQLKRVKDWEEIKKELL